MSGKEKFNLENRSNISYLTFFLAHWRWHAFVGRGQVPSYISLPSQTVIELEFLLILYLPLYLIKFDIVNGHMGLCHLVIYT